MKTLSRIILIITALISLNACTHNNGDIGHLFGTWRLNTITINGDVDSVYAKADNRVVEIPIFGNEHDSCRRCYSQSG